MAWNRTCYAFAAFVILLWFPAFASGAQQPYAISIRTVHDTFKSGAEIMVGVNLTNTSDKDILVIGACAPKADVDSLRIEVTDSKSKVAPETNFLRWLRGEPIPRPEYTIWNWSGPSCGAVPPKRFIDTAFILNRFYDLSNPGKYKIQVQRTDLTSKITVKSNIIEVTVTP